MPSKRPDRREGVKFAEILEPRTLLSVAFNATTSSSDANLLALIGQARVADVDGDGKSDVVVGANTAGETGTLTRSDVLLGTGTGTFNSTAGPAFSAGTATSTNAFAVGDFNGDGKADLVYADQSSDASLDGVVTTQLNTSTAGAASFTAAAGVTITAPTNFNPQQVVTADFNADGHLDAAILGLTGNAESLVVLSGNGAGGFTEAYHAAVQVVSGTALSDGVLLSGDFNGDGKPDLAVYDPSSGEITFFVDTGSTFSQTAAPISLNETGYTPGPITAADLTADGKSDLIVGENSNASTGDTVAVFVSTGSGTSITFAGRTPVPAGNANGEAIGGVVAADFDGDGHVDVATDYGVLLGDGTGTLASPASALATTSLAGTQGYTALLTGDLNADGKPDLIGINQSNHTVVSALDASTAPVAQLATTTVLVSSKTAITQGAAVTLTATVSSSGGTPGGYVNFLSGTTLLGSAALGAGGVASLSTTALPAGTDSLTATFLGNSSYDASTSAAVTESVTTSSSGTGTGGSSGSGGGSGGSSGGTSTPTLPDSSTLTPSLVALKLPAEEVAAQRINLIVPVTITNTAAAIYTGAVSVALYASDAAGFDGTQQLLQTHLIKRLSLRSDRGFTLRLRVTALPAALTGTVYLLATVTDASGNATGIASATPSTVAAPFTAITTAVTTLKSASSVVGGSKTSAFAIVTLINNGNVNYLGQVTIALFGSTTAAVPTGATALNSVTLGRLGLRPNVPRRLRVPLKNNPAATTSTADDIVARTTDAAGNQTSGTSATTITVAPPFIALSGSATPTLTSVVAGRRSTVGLLLTLTNAGNIAAAGTATFTLFASTTNRLTSAAIALPGSRYKLSIAPRRSRRIRLAVSTLSAEPVGAYYLITQVSGLGSTKLLVTTSTAVNVIAS